MFDFITSRSSVGQHGAIKFNGIYFQYSFYSTDIGVDVCSTIRHGLTSQYGAFRYSIDQPDIRQKQYFSSYTVEAQNG